jgi:hypothetical protein
MERGAECPMSEVLDKILPLLTLVLGSFFGRQHRQAQ